MEAAAGNTGGGGGVEEMAVLEMEDQDCNSLLHIRFTIRFWRISYKLRWCVLPQIYIRRYF